MEPAGLMACSEPGRVNLEAEPFELVPKRASTSIYQPMDPSERQQFMTWGVRVRNASILSFGRLVAVFMTSLYVGGICLFISQELFYSVLPFALISAGVGYTIRCRTCGNRVIEDSIRRYKKSPIYYFVPWIDRHCKQCGSDLGEQLLGPKIRG